MKQEMLRTFVMGIVLGLSVLTMPVFAGYNVVFLQPSGFDWTDGMGISAGQQIGYGLASGDGYHAMLWSGTAGSYIDLNPAGYGACFGLGISGGQQVGWGLGPGPWGHALLWTGTAASYVDLTPPTGSGYTYGSMASAVGDGQQVGYASASGTSFMHHAMLWSGTPESYVDLHPDGFPGGSEATAVAGGQQVGAGWLVPWQADPQKGPLNPHALLWSATAGSAVDLNPAGFDGSVAYGIYGGQQFGMGYESSTGGNRHALAWLGTADSYIDLNPTGFVESIAGAFAAGQLIGNGYGPATGGDWHALVWSSLTDGNGYVDLHQFLPPGYYASNASGIDSFGNIIGTAVPIAGSGRREQAVMWVYRPDVVPAPGAIVLSGIGAGLVTWLRRRRIIVK